jgi:4-hydroxy-2-oxoheptanedioate aldolase
MPQPRRGRKFGFATPAGWGIIRSMTTPPVPEPGSGPSAIPPRPGLRRRVLAGEPTLGLWVMLGSIAAADVMARAGYDWLMVDLEHGMFEESQVLGLLTTIQGSGTAGLVRVVSAERMRVGRILDLGADGVMIPRLESVEEIRETLSWMRYPPAGVRGLAQATRGAGYFTVAHPEIRLLSDSILGVFQVESPAAVDIAEQVAQLDGVDVLFVGPADLSHAMGIPGEFTNPQFVEALDHVAAVARAHGKAPGMLVRGADEVAAYRARGYTFLGIGADLGLVATGARSQLAAARAAL